jgi:ankyrin repeat protein
MTMLKHAIANDDETLVRTSLDRGEDVNAEWCPLWKAINHSLRVGLTRSAICPTKIIELLVERGADIHLEREGYTPLAYASSCGSVEIVLLLIDNGVNLFQECEEGDTAVQMVSHLCECEIGFLDRPETCPLRRVLIEKRRLIELILKTEMCIASRIARGSEVPLHLITLKAKLRDVSELFETETPP